MGQRLKMQMYRKSKWVMVVTEPSIEANPGHEEYEEIIFDDPAKRLRMM